VIGHALANFSAAMGAAAITAAMAVVWHIEMRACNLPANQSIFNYPNFPVATRTPP